jgi:hypothetical protein
MALGEPAVVPARQLALDDLTVLSDGLVGLLARIDRTGFRRDEVEGDVELRREMGV